MGTNFYLVRRKPTIREAVHICKRSWGWKTTWQATDESEWPRWCDTDHMERDTSGLPYGIHSIEDARSMLESGDWMLVDEYGTVYGDEPHEEDLYGSGAEVVGDWRTTLDELEAWDGGKSSWNERHPEEQVTWEPRDHVRECGSGYHDRTGNVFMRECFC